MGPLNGTNQKLHSQFDVNGYNITGWPLTGANRIFAGYSWSNDKNQTDGAICYLRVTGNSSTDTVACLDGYRSDINLQSSISNDTKNDIVFNSAKSSVVYYNSTTGNQRFLNWTAHFSRSFDTNDTAQDIVIKNGDSFKVYTVRGTIQGTNPFTSVSTANITLKLNLEPQTTSAFKSLSYGILMISSFISLLFVTF